MYDEYIKTVENSTVINIVCILTVLANIILLSFGSNIYIIGLSIGSVACLYVCLIAYKKQFDFPLFFARDRFSYWGALMGGLMSLSASIPSYLLIQYSSLSFPEELSLIIMACCLLSIIIISYTAALISDVKNTEHIEIK